MSETHRFDRQFWQRFLALTQPYWYPISSSGLTFLGLLLLLLVFVSIVAFIAVSIFSLLGQSYFPEILNSVAPGLAESILQIIQSPAIYLIALCFLITLVSFAYYRRKLEEHWRAWLMLTLLLLLVLGSIGMQVFNSYLGRDLITAMAQQRESSYFLLLVLYTGSLIFFVPFVVLSHYARKKLSIHWQQWLTNEFLAKYFHQRAYYNLKTHLNIDNPDQRLSKEIESFTQTIMDFLVTIFNQLINLIAFGIILWSISKFLVVILIVYAVVGNVITIISSRQLVDLNTEKLKYEANFRYSLIRVSDNAESIAFSRGENQELSLVKQRFTQFVENINRMIGWERNIEFLSLGYQNILFIIPFLVVGPLYFSGQVELGVITQASMACAQLSAALSVIVSRFESLSSLAAVVNRLATFTETMTPSQTTEKSLNTIEPVEDNRFAIEALTLQTPNSEQILVKELSVSVEPGKNVLIMGASGCGKSSLLRAIAGLWKTGMGRILRPGFEEILFLPQRPYMILGSLRQQLLYPNGDHETPDDKLESVLHQVNLPQLLGKVGSFEAELDWSNVLSLGEQQRLAFARLLLNRPRYAFLDEATSALDLQNEKHLYQQLQDSNITFVSVGHRESLLNYHQQVLKLLGDANWQLSPADKTLVNLN